MSLRCIIVDDEPLARKLLKDYCAKVPFIELLGDFSSGLSAMEFMRKNKVDFLFLDIKMPDISGLEIAKILNPKPGIIFTTAFAEYAVDGFDLNAVDYLLKPFDFARFLKAVNKVSDKKTATVKEVPTEDEKNFLFVKDGRELVKIHFKDIQYIQGSKDYVTFHCEDRKVMSLMTMRDLENDLPQKQFLRIHQSFIIGTSHIESVSNDKVKIKDTYIPVSQTYKQQFKAFLENHIG